MRLAYFFRPAGDVSKWRENKSSVTLFSLRGKSSAGSVVSRGFSAALFSPTQPRKVCHRSPRGSSWPKKLRAGILSLTCLQNIIGNVPSRYWQFWLKVFTQMHLYYRIIHQFGSTKVWTTLWCLYWYVLCYKLTWIFSSFSETHSILLSIGNATRITYFCCFCIPFQTYSTRFNLNWKSIGYLSGI